MGKGFKKAVPVKGTGPKVPKDAQSGNKYSTGETGRSAPPNIGKRHKSRTNP